MGPGGRRVAEAADNGEISVDDVVDGEGNFDTVARETQQNQTSTARYRLHRSDHGIGSPGCFHDNVKVVSHRCGVCGKHIDARQQRKGGLLGATTQHRHVPRGPQPNNGGGQESNRASADNENSFSGLRGHA